MNERPNLSILIPFFNEEESIDLLSKKLVDVLEGGQRSWEIILVDDGSTDNSNSIASQIASEDSRVKLIEFKTNHGKARALNEGFKIAMGSIIFTMDADLQDDPKEIPRFLEEIDKGYDLVSGWKKLRHDPLEKRLPSKVFNSITSMITGIKLHDFNCGFKAYKREIFDDIRIYGDLHRYVPALAHWKGFRVGEIVVKHHPRPYGKSKYGLERYFRGFFDLFTVALITKFIRNPAYLFGIIGLFIFGAGLAIVLFLTGVQLTFGSILGFKNMSYIGALSILAGSQALSLGLLSEIIVNLSERAEGSQVSIKEILKKNGSEPCFLSIIIPVKDEEKNISTLYPMVEEELQRLKKKYEVIFVDDGSTDRSFDEMKEIYEKAQNVSIVRLRMSFGKALALQTGFDFARGQIIATMDADHQNNPAELHRLIAKLGDGYDFVIGHRVEVPFFRAVNSFVFNKIVSVLSGVKIHDINCGLKVFRCQAIKNIKFYGELQRFFPIFISRAGFKIAEVKIKHNERLHGKRKYGWTRIPKAFLDLFTVILLTGFKSRPLHLFGSIGCAIFVTGALICFYLLIERVVSGGIGGHYTMLLMGIVFVILGFQWFSVGLLSELLNDYYQKRAEVEARN